MRVTGRGAEHPREGPEAAGNPRRSGRRELRGPWSGRSMSLRLAYRLPAPPSDRERQGAQSGQCATELCSPGPALGKVQDEAAGRACKSSDQGEEASSEGPGGHHLLPQTDAGGPAGEVVSQYLNGQPGGVGGKAP